MRPVATDVTCTVVKFEEINIKFKNVRDPHSITHSQLLADDTQYSRYCNDVKLHTVQCTSPRFMATAHFNNEGYTSSHKSLQKLEFHSHSESELSSEDQLTLSSRNYLHF